MPGSCSTILSLPKNGFLNLHFSLLPAYRGAAPAQRALHNGEVTTGVTVFQLDKGMDTGPIFAQESIAINPSWRSFELLNELASLGPDVVKRSIEMIESGKSSSVQVGNSSNAPKISKAEAKIDFTQDSTLIANAIRAFTYEPGAWCTWKNEPFKITSAVAVEDESVQPAEIVFDGQEVIVGCGNKSTIQLLTVVPAGKKEMSAADWARGARLQGGDSFD